MTDPKTTYTFVIVGTNIKLTFTGNSFTNTKRSENSAEHKVNMQILRDDTIQTVKKKLLMQLNRVYPTDVAYEELFLTAYAVSMPDPAQIFREALVALKTDQRVYLTQTEVSILCKKYGCNTPALALNKTDKYYLSDFISVFQEPTRKLVAIGAKFAEHKYPFFIPDPSIPVTSDIELDFSETQLLFQYGELSDNVIHVNIAQHSLSDSEPGQHESILRTFYRSLQYTHGIVNFAQLNEKHAELVEHTNAAITEKTERAFKSVQVFHDIYATRTEEMPWMSRGIMSIHFALNTNSTQGFPLESIFKSVHSSRQTPLIKYTPGNRREPIYRIYSERVSPNGQKIAYLPEKKITKLARELGKSGQVSVYILCKRNDVSLNMHFDRTGLLIIECEFNQSFSETDATEIISSELNPILKQVGKYTPGLNIPDFLSLREVDILQMKYVMKCEITKNIVFKNMPCLNSILLVESSDLVAGASLRYVRVDNYREMNAQTMFINDNRDDVPTMMTGLMRNFGMSEEEAKMRIVSFFNEHADIRGKVLDNPGFLVDMRIPRMESAVVITVERVTSLKYVDLLHLYFDSILRLSQKPKTTAVTNEHMLDICKGRAAKSLIDTAAVVQNLPAKPIAIRNETFNLMEALGLKETETVQEFAEDDDDTGVFFADFEEQEQQEETPKSTSPETNDSVLHEKVASESLNSGEVEETPKVASESLKETPKVASESLKETPKVASESLEETSKVASESLEETPKVASESLEETPKVASESLEETPKVASESLEETPKVASESLNSGETSPDGERGNYVSSMLGGADESQEEVEEADDVTQGDTDDDKYKQDPTGMPLKNPNPFLKRLKQRDPRLFLTRDQGKYRAYSTKCQPTERQPVILTDAEKEKIDRENPGSYKHAIKYGTDKDHQFWYICPRYWCFRTNTSITEEDVKAGKCGRVITDEDIKRGTVPKDAHVYEFKSAKTHLDAKGKYIQHYPGFATKDDMHPDGFCLPCCFKEWDSGRQGTKKQECMNPQAAAASRPAGAEIRQQLYIMDSYPLPNDRWGFLPNVARMFFGVDYKPVIDKHNASAIIPGQFVLLRYGVEQVHSQSFLGVFADMYAAQQKTPIPSVSEFRELLATAITLDVFINIHNASLPQIFKKAKKGKIQLDKYKNTDFYKRLSVAEDKDHRLFFEDAIVAYENFQEYLRDSNTEIDHTYLWDVFCAKMPNIHPDGLNLVMLEIVDNDATEKIELVCPTNSHSSNSFDPKKQTVFVLKRDEFYEPIYLYKTDGKEIQAQKTFSTASLHPNIKQILNMVGKVTGKYCAPLTSLPKVYKFRTPVNATELLTLFPPGPDGATKYTAVINYRNKVVGIHNGKVVIPCYPSSLHGLAAANLPVKFMDEPELFADYETTRDELQRVYDASPKINCKPAFKIVDEGLIVGILTLTNQFVQISTPSENVMDDGIETMENPNWNEEDRSVVKGPDSERVKMSKWISLESQFYAVFQMLARELLQDPIQSHRRDKLIRISDSQTIDYAVKIKECERILRELMSSSVEFAEMEDGFLLHLDNVSGCYSGDESPYCVMQDDGTQKTLFPAKHLLSGFDNDKVYYGRLADQLVRYSRVRTYVLFPDVSINTRTVDYDLDENELLLVHSDITPEYFRRIDSSSTNPYVTNTAYDFAQPSITQYYSRDTVPFDEQYNLANAEQDQTLECVKPGLIPIVGNTRSMWVQSFPKTAREKVFLNTPECTFHLMVHILQDYFNKPINVAGVRKLLWVAYAPYMEHYADRIVSVLKAQGKHTLMESVEKRRVTLETLIFSNNYYLSDLDIWVMASRYNLPIIIFTSTFLKGFSKRISWLRAGMDKTGGLYYFVRSGVTTTPNNVGENHLVIPKMTTTGLGEFSEQFKAAISGNEEHRMCVESFDAFMQSR